MGRNILFFDLDGTITDPKEGITKATAIALSKYGILEDPETLTRFIGPPLLDAFSQDYGFPPEQAAEAVGHFREYYNRQGWLENVPYPGIEDFLQAMQQAGKQLVIATSKPEPIANRVLEHFGLAKYFALICGAPVGNAVKSNKTMVIRDALQRLNITDLNDVIMVGDRRHDVEGAHEVGMAAIGVLYGYGSREELEGAGADHIAADVAELTKLCHQI